MIISKVRGGVGNQLFQWAAGYALAQKFNTELLLDLSVYDRNKTRNFELDKLGCPHVVATDEQVAELQKHSFYKQPHFHYDQLFAELLDDTFIRGYFCSERYFLNSSDDIRKVLGEVLCSTLLSVEQSELLDYIKGHSCTSVHVRRGDYIADQGYNDFFGTCSLDYYAAAGEFIEKNSNTKAIFVVFSDDLEWAKANISLPGDVKFASVNSGFDSYLDLFFMGSCQNNIIANSTFSWWAAWLNNNLGKLVVCPKKWFRSTYREKSGQGVWIKSPHYTFDDLFPSEWHVM